MTEEERKMLAFVAKMVQKLSVANRGLTLDEDQQLENIADDLGYYELEDDEFCY